MLMRFALGNRTDVFSRQLVSAAAEPIAEIAEKFIATRIAHQKKEKKKGKKERRVASNIAKIRVIWLVF
jgi:hypothetical protein